MLQSTLAKIEALINQNELINNVDSKKVSNLLNYYKKDMWIYPSVLKRKLQVDIKTAYSILNLLEDQDLIERYYELYCFDCQHSTGLLKKTMNLFVAKIGFIVECDTCQRTLFALENCRVVFVVVTE